MAKSKETADEAKPKRSTRKKADEGETAPAAKQPATKASEAKPTTEASAPAKDSAKAKAQAAEPVGTPAAASAAGTLDASLLPAQSGKLGVFGGPKDRGVKPEDKLALPTGKHFSFERVRSLNPKSFYCAMRWDYHVLGKSNEEGKRWWANKKLLVSNPASGVAIVVRAVDYGPPESTGLAIAVSPGAAEALGVNVGDEVEISFADPRLPAGVVQQG